MNLKQRFAKARRLERPLGLNGALQLAGMQFTGQQHRALEDARNTARLLPLVLPAVLEQVTAPGPCAYWPALFSPFRGIAHV